jgi:hypothetical protein
MPETTMRTLQVGDRVRVRLSNRCPLDHETLLDGQPGKVDGAEGEVRRIFKMRGHRIYVSDAGGRSDGRFTGVDGFFTRYELEKIDKR